MVDPGADEANALMELTRDRVGTVAIVSFDPGEMGEWLREKEREKCGAEVDVAIDDIEALLMLFRLRAILDGRDDLAGAAEEGGERPTFAKKDDAL